MNSHVSNTQSEWISALCRSCFIYPPRLFQISQGLSTHIHIFSTQRCLLTVSKKKKKNYNPNQKARIILKIFYFKLLNGQSLPQISMR